MFGLVFLVGGALGSVCGGALAARLRPRLGARANLAVVAVGLAMLVVPVTLAPLQPTGARSLALFAPVMFLFAFPSGAAAAYLQDIAPPELRGRLSAVYYIVMNLVGLTSGSLLVAGASDHLFSSSLAHGLALVGSIGALVAATMALMAFRGPPRHISPSTTRAA